VFFKKIRDVRKFSHGGGCDNPSKLDMIASQANHSLDKTMKVYSSPALLVIDEVGCLPSDKQGSDHFFNVIFSRYERVRSS